MLDLEAYELESPVGEAEEKLLIRGETPPSVEIILGANLVCHLRFIPSIPCGVQVMIEVSNRNRKFFLIIIGVGL